MPSDDPGGMRVILLARPAEGGIRSHLIHLLERLDRSRFQMLLAAPAKLLGSLPEELPAFDTYDLPITARPSLLDPLAALKLANLVKQKGGIVHAHGIRAAFVACLAKLFTSFPLVVTIHNIPPKSRLGDLALGIITNGADRIIAVSKAIAERLPNATVIPNGINLNLFGDTDRNAAREKLGLKPKTIAAVCVARLSPEKGVDLLLRAARMLPEITFLIAGAGPESVRLEINAPVNVQFLGYVDNVPETFTAADIAVIPSRTEGQGIVALEAMSAGAAMVAFDVGGLGEMIENGVTGLLAHPEDPTNLAQKIRVLAGDEALRGRLAGKGREWVWVHGDVRERVREIEAILSDIGSMPGLS